MHFLNWDEQKICYSVMPSKNLYHLSRISSPAYLITRGTISIQYSKVHWIRKEYHPENKIHGAKHGAHLGPFGTRWDPCWPHEPCYQGISGCSRYARAPRPWHITVYYQPTCHVIYFLWPSIPPMSQTLVQFSAINYANIQYRLVQYGLVTIRQPTITWKSALRDSWWHMGSQG